MTGTDTRLASPAVVAAATEWQVDGGRVYASARGTDCVRNTTCAYQWQADGSFTNLSTNDPFAGSTSQEHPVARDRRVVWTNSDLDNGGVATSYTLFDVYRWDDTSRASTKRSTPGAKSTRPQTDGMRMA